MPKVIKKKKLKIIPFFLFVLVIAGIIFGVDVFLDTRIQNIIIGGNEILSDQQILELASLTDYPSFYKTTDGSIEDKLLENPFVEKVSVKRSFYHVVTIHITEHQVLFKKESDGKLVLDNKEEIATDQVISYCIPRLINYVPNTKYDQFIKGMLEINADVREKISEISYVPNDYDKDRFLLYMDDGNSVYLTLTKFNMINYYNEVLPQLGGKKGILYLDSGNHFQIME